MIGYALVSDIPALVELARAEHALSPWKDAPFDAEHVAQLMREFIETPGRVLFRSDRGYLAGMVQQSGFSGQKLAMEYALYADDGSGMDLVRVFEAWGEGMGAAGVVVHDYMGDGRLAEVMKRRRGYQPLGLGLVKLYERGA